MLKRDQDELDPHGQRTSKTFQVADVFVHLDERRLGEFKKSVQRFVDLVFGAPFQTPTRDEHAMFLAFAASLRSADLSRQVGAVVVSSARLTRKVLRTLFASAAPWLKGYTAPVRVAMRHWWVNQNQTYHAEIRGNFMWSPKTNANGARNQFYDNMRLVVPGDIVFSFCDTRIKAVGVVTGTAQTAPKPDFGGAGLNWSKEGWFVPVYYATFDDPVRPKDHIAALRPFLPAKYSPLQTGGDGLQSVYLAAVPELMAAALIEAIGQPYFDALAALTGFPSTPDVEETVEAEPDAVFGPTFREQLVKARRGQGVFRANVMLVEDGCRVTHVTDPKHLRASHIKPWRDASNDERLKGHNGLLLSPHIDHLFDQGYISFSPSEQLLVVPEVRTDLLGKWGIDAGTRVGTFTVEQQAFLEYHRVNVFNRARGG